MEATAPLIVLNEPAPPPSPTPSFSSRRSGMSTPISLTNSTSSSSISSQNEKPTGFITPPPSPSPFMRAFYESQPPPSPTVSRHSSNLFHHLRNSINPLPLNWRFLWRQNPSLSSEKSKPTQPIQNFFERHEIRRRTGRLLLWIFLPTAVMLLFAASITAGWWSSIYSGTMSRGTGALQLQQQQELNGLNGINDGLGGWTRHGSADAISRGRKHHHHHHERRLSTPTLVARATTSVDAADEPVLSLGGGLGSTTTPTPTISAPTGTSTTTRTDTTAPSVPSNPVLPTPFVQPFDETISTDFLSGTCQTFFNNFTQDLSFRQCRPFSLLYSDSEGFLSAQTNLTLLTSIIYGTCNTTPSDSDCVARMDDLAGQLKSNCEAELNAGQALSWDAMNGFKNYEMYRKAACLLNQRTNAYCFAEAVAALEPSDVYFWQLPMGTPLPGTQSTSSNTATATGGSGGGVAITATCSACTQSLMSVYAGYASNSSLLISQTYSKAAKLVDTSCGSQYAAVVGSGAGRRMSSPVFNPLEGLLALLMVVMSMASLL